MVDQLITVDSDSGPQEPTPVSIFYNGSVIDFTGIAGPVQTARLVSSAGSTNAISLKTSSTRLIGVMGYNAIASGRYLKLYNKASTPVVGTDIPMLTFYLPPSAAFPPYTLGPMLFSLGLGIALTTGSADADTGAVTAGDILGLNITFT